MRAIYCAQSVCMERKSFVYPWSLEYDSSTMSPRSERLVMAISENRLLRQRSDIPERAMLSTALRSLALRVC